MTVVTRFAPSPTGSLHVGGARTALYCLLHARKHDGRFLLRIEDTDQARSTEESTQGILRDLRWLGLEWDEGPDKDLGRGPYFQSQRLPIYQGYLDRLMASGHAYEAWDSREELQAMRELARAEKRDFRYRRADVSDAQVQAYRAEGRVPVLRLAAPDHDVQVLDVVQGTVTLAAEQLEDIVIRKADGFPTYHFAVVIDDQHMEVTQILRGKEHLMNAPKHLGIMEALGWSPPKFGHLPLIFNPGGTKMSKRDKAKAAREGARIARDAGSHTGWGWLATSTSLDEAELTRFMKKKNDEIPTAEAIAEGLDLDLPMIEVMDFWKAGYLPEALNNYLALLGWNPGPEADTGEERELFTLDELIARWDLSRVGKSSARFDPDKLRWMNGEYLRSLSDERIEHHYQSWLSVCESELSGLEPELRKRIFALYRPRAHTFAELEAGARWLWTRPTSYDAKAVKKWIIKGDGWARLPDLAALLATAEWTEAGLESAFTSHAEAVGVGMGKLAQPLRVALSGSAATPGLFECLVLFSRAEVLARIEVAIAELTPA
ncbi:MAG: glutamate--tRNA ligase [Myxococcota bacterium]